MYNFHEICFSISLNGIYSKPICHGSLLRQIPFQTPITILSSSQKLYPFFMILCMDQIYHGEFFRKICEDTMESDK
uniref:Uncharacterized protein n=1 Tax=Salix viminalis TaxID=40686 RepID=A0A6N2KYC5_SALVM